uniref:C-type lectin domain family 2 member D-like n=1 Tax=Podarcis muralis TaxID=64176 RepID=A0A670IRM7_PODMU|nr:C-type lectin domain family 2 member D-like [Podarcis muralis]
MLCADPSTQQNILSLAGGKSNQTCPDVFLRATCPAGWIVYEGKCYFFSEEEKNWTSAQSFCISQGSSLAEIQCEHEKVFMFRFKGEADHWIGLQKDFNDTWIWADGSEYSNTLVVKGSENCAYLSKKFVIPSHCNIPKKWICSHPDAYMRNKNSTAGKVICQEEL